MDPVAFRVDAGEAIGTGHLVRCLTLADALAQRGAPAHFLCRGLPEDLQSLIASHGHEVTALESGSSDEIDAEQTLRATDGRSWSWMVVDHYGLDRGWEDALQARGPVLAIDDLANRHHACNLLLDQNMVAGASSRYDSLLPDTCRRMLGPGYALLNPLYADLHDRVPPREGPVERVLISFGGFDPDFLTERALGALVALKRPETAVDVVIADESRAAAIGRRYPGDNVHVHRRLPTLAPLIARADLAIGASGSTTWERLCLGLPSLIITFADNQTPIADELHQRGLARWIGSSRQVDAAALVGAIKPIIDKGLDAEWSRRCAAAVDGRGTARVCAAMTATADTQLHVRHARVGDEALLLEWANDPATRRNAFSPEAISSATHRTWFRRRLREIDACRLFVIETSAGVPIGHVRFQQSDGRWEVHYAVAPAFRSRGLGRQMLGVSLEAFRQMTGPARVFGQVQPANAPSCRIFERLGFERLADSGTGGSVVYERTLTDQQQT